MTPEHQQTDWEVKMRRKMGRAKVKGVEGRREPVDGFV